MAEKARRDHYPAPYAIIELWRDFGGDVRNVPKEHPASIDDLFHHPDDEEPDPDLQAAGSAEGAWGRTVTRRAIESTVHVIGAGAMGGDIAAWCALRGLTVTLQDLAPDRISPAIKRARGALQEAPAAAAPRAGRDGPAVPDVKGDGVARADLVIEAIVENAEVKRKVFAQIEPRMKEAAILASNTSSIPLQELASSPEAPRAARRHPLLQSRGADDAGRDRRRARRPRPT